MNEMREIITDAKVAAAREYHRSAQRQTQEDLAALLTAGAGQRFLAAQLKALNMGSMLENNAGEIALYNQGVELVKQIAAVSPQGCLAILADVFGIYQELT